MIKRLFLIILISYFFTGCHISNDLENSLSKGFEIIFPDTCEIYLIGQIYNFRNLSGELPNNSEIKVLLDSLNSGCQQKLDSVGVIPYKTDSIDLLMRKNFKGFADTADFLITKVYRIKFENDSMQIEYLIAPIKSNNKYQNKKFRLKNGQTTIGSSYNNNLE